MDNGFQQAGSALGQAFFGNKPDTQPQAMDAAARTAYVWRRAQEQRQQEVAAQQFLDTVKDPQERALIASHLGQVFAQTQRGLATQDERGYKQRATQMALNPNVDNTTLNRFDTGAKLKTYTPTRIEGNTVIDTGGPVTQTTRPTSLGETMGLKNQAEARAANALADKRARAQEPGSKGLTANEKVKAAKLAYQSMIARNVFNNDTSSPSFEAFANHLYPGLYPSVSAWKPPKPPPKTLQDTHWFGPTTTDPNPDYAKWKAEYGNLYKAPSSDHVSNSRTFVKGQTYTDANGQRAIYLGGDPKVKSSWKEIH